MCVCVCVCVCVCTLPFPTFGADMGGHGLLGAPIGPQVDLAQVLADSGRAAGAAILAHSVHFHPRGLGHIDVCARVFCSLSVCSACYSA